MTKDSTFVYFIAPDHGWLEVSLEDLDAVDVPRRYISRYSTFKKSYAYLEEDCDAGIFLAAFRAKYGSEPTIVENVIDDRSVIGL